MPIYQIISPDGTIVRVEVKSVADIEEGATLLGRIVGANVDGNGGFVTDDATGAIFDELIASNKPAAPAT